MTFEEAREAIRGLVGRMVEVSVGLIDQADEMHALADFGGRVQTVTRSGAGNLPERWYVHLEKDGEPKPSYSPDGVAEPWGR